VCPEQCAGCDPRPEPSVYTCMKHLLVGVILLCVFTRHLAAQIVSASMREPEHLIIGLAALLRWPNPFPLTLPASASALDSVKARNLAPRD